MPLEAIRSIATFHDDYESVTARQPTGAEWVLRFPRRRTGFEGRVVDGEGRPCAGVPVRIHERRQDGRWGNEKGPVTGPDGRFTTRETHLPPGAYEISSLTGLFDPFEVRVEPGEVLPLPDIVVRPFARLLPVRVVLDDAPPAGTPHLRLADGTDVIVESGEPVLVPLDGLPVRLLLVSREQPISAEVVVERLDPERTTRVRLAPRPEDVRILRARVLDARTGEPVPRISILVHHPGGSVGGPVETPGGHLRYVLPPGEDRVEVRAPGHVAGTLDPDRPDEQELRLEPADR